MLGHGKSSIINTCVQIVHQADFKNVAGSGKSNYPITMDRTDYDLTSHVVINDNRGVNKMSPEEQEEVAAQMGQMRGQSTVEWDRSVRGKLNLIYQQFNYRPIEITVPVFVYSVESLLTDERYEEIEPFIREAHKITGIYPIIVLTKVGTHRDMADECYDKFKALGANHVFQVENYTVEQHEHHPKTQAEVLKFLDTCLKEVDESIARRATEDPQKKYMDLAMDAVHNIIQKENEKKEIKIQIIKEKCEKSKEEIRRQKNV
ncbi:uncharacterized protein LOC130284045 [Hyla sarda]|uniref:uncharacterized protein LOC130284045 n=1 Tax=Hyla sarda TaxID=327740 RepID=UPI0024C38D56|nr:uncharacterized protein LOC130284045 [Hyla sarda]XP_056389946.1 uncharacterized protein LOC130284045 [Hyla sarda]